MHVHVSLLYFKCQLWVVARKSRILIQYPAQWVLIKRGTENGMKQEIKQKFRSKTTYKTAYKRILFETKQILNFR